MQLNAYHPSSYPAPHAYRAPHRHTTTHHSSPPPPQRPLPAMSQMSLPFLTMQQPSSSYAPAASTPAAPVVPVAPRSATPPPPRAATPPPPPPPRKSLAKPASRASSTQSSSSAPAKKVRSSKSNIPGSSRYWTPSEHRLFVVALLKYGPKDLKSIAAHVGTRNMIQCRTHEQKCFMRLMREAQRETEQRAAAAAAAERAAAAAAECEDGSAASAATDVGGCNESAASEVDRPPVKQAKEVYSVSSSCGITLLSVVGDELMRALST